MSTADTKQVAGTHYKVADPGAQHWNMLLSAGYGAEYYVGQATKYLTRWRKKNGLRDLAKGKHFIEKLLEVVNERGVDFLPHGHITDENLLAEIGDEALTTYLDHYFEVNEVDEASRAICTLVLFANTADTLRYAIAECERLETSEVARETEEQNKEKEPPVAVDFSFLGYIDDDRMHWQCKCCNAELKLRLTEPPNLVHKCPGAALPLRAVWPF